LLRAALRDGRTPVIYGSGNQSRDFTYVENVVAANRLALAAKTLGGEAVNIAGGHRVTLKQLLKLRAREIGRPAKAEHREARAGDVQHSLADIRLARKLIGY